jgi:hypothetical protein
MSTREEVVSECEADVHIKVWYRLRRTGVPVEHCSQRTGVVDVGHG